MENIEKTDRGAALQVVAPFSRLPAWLSFSGVISRQHLVMGMLPLFILGFLLAQLQWPVWLTIPLGLPLIYVLLTLLVKRLRDAGWHWGFVALGFVPFIGWLILAFLVSAPSTEGQPRRSAWARFGTGFAAFITIAVVASATVPLPAESPVVPNALTSAEAPDAPTEPDAPAGTTGEGENSPEPDSSPYGAAVSGDSTIVEEEPPLPESGVETDPLPPAESSGSNPSELEALVAQLRVEPEMQAGYDRDLFPHWRDADGDGCDTRREVLIAESLAPVSVGAGCSLSGGQWYSVFDGVTTTDPSDFDIDHFVPLKEAWDSGAHSWDPQTRRQFANDLSYAGSLIAVSASSNRTKGASDPAEWLPPNTDYRCVYLTTWVEVKIRWNLSADDREISAIRSAGARC